MFMFEIKNLFSQSISKFELLARLIFYGLLFVISASFIIFLFFLYQHFYLAMAQAEEIVVLKSQLAVDVLDVELYDKVKTAAETRKTIPIPKWEEIPNPFLPYK